MATLLTSLGKAAAIVPEAFLLPGVMFSKVHVLTTDSDAISLAFASDWFADQAPEVDLTMTRVADFVDFASEADHFHFEEVLFRWWIEQLSALPKGESPYVCIAGGFKTMSAAMQKAAALLGAAEVFHVLCDLPFAEQPKTAEEIAAARDGRHLHWIRLGSESGWPQLQGLASADFPLEVLGGPDRNRRVRAPDHAFRDHLQEIQERSHRIAGAWDQLAALPFPILATWSGADLAWLREPVDPESPIDSDWIAGLAKIELHCHLGGFATHGDALLEVRAAAHAPGKLKKFVEPELPQTWPLPDQNIPLEDYMRLGDANGSALLGDSGCLRRQCGLLYNHFLTQKILYAEVRCSPANYAGNDRSPWTVLAEIRDAFNRCMAEARQSGANFCHINLLLIATRRKGGDYRAAISRHLALAVSAAEHWTAPEECRVVGVDLAGYEDPTTRAHYFCEEFTGVHRCGLALTVHAGENDDAEAVWRAVFDLNARRLGHALRLVESPELMRSVADRGVTVEMCPYANYQIAGFPLMANADDERRYPLKRYLNEGLRVTVNTDNIGISQATLTDNFLLAARLCPDLSRLDLLRLLSNAADAAFLSPVERGALRTRLASNLPPP